MPSQHDKAMRFRALHETPGIFVIPNVWDGGSASVMAGLGFEALATSSAACAATLGKLDGEITREEALAHGRFVAYQPTSLQVRNGRVTPADPASIRANLTMLRPRFDSLVTACARDCRRPRCPRASPFTSTTRSRLLRCSGSWIFSW